MEASASNNDNNNMENDHNMEEDVPAQAQAHAQQPPLAPLVQEEEEDNEEEYLEEGDFEVVDLPSDDEEPMDDDDDADDAKFAEGEKIGSDPIDEEGAGASAEDATATTEPIIDNSDAIATNHNEAVFSVAMFNNGEMMVSGGGDRAVIAKVSTGELIHALDGHTDSVVSVAVSSDETMIATGALDSTVCIWSTVDGKLLHKLEGPTEEVEWVCWHPNGPVVLAGSADGTAWMWEARSGQTMSVFAGHEASLTCGMFTVTGKKVLTASLDSSVKVWDPRTSQCLHTFKGHGWHDAGVVSLAIHPVEPMIAAGGQDGTVRVARLETKRVIASFAHSKILESANVIELAAAADARGAGGDTEMSTKGTLDQVAGVEAVAFCPVQPWVVSGGTDGVVRVWDLKTKRCRYSLDGHRDSITRMLFLPASTMLVTCSTDATAKLWDSRNGQVQKVMTGHSEGILDVAVNGRRVVTASDDKTCRYFLLEQ